MPETNINRPLTLALAPALTPVTHMRVGHGLIRPANHANTCHQRDVASLHLATSGAPANPSAVSRAGAAFPPAGKLASQRDEAGCAQVCFSVSKRATRRQSLHQKKLR